MLQRPWMARIVMVTALCVAGCQSAPRLEPTGHTVIPVKTKAGPGGMYEAAVHLMDEVEIQLPRVQAAGNVWTVVLNDARFFHQLRPVLMHPDGTATATFLAIRAGHRPIRFFALPPNGREATPTESYEIRITVE